MRFFLILITSVLILFPFVALASPLKGEVQITGWLNSENPPFPLRAQQTPNDPRFPAQWYLNRIKIPTAWNRTVGSSSTIVAVIDTGINTNHEDLKDRLWTNPREIPNNNFDDDGNGYLDDYQGFNFLNNNADLSDPHGHGTGAASVIAAASNNGLGMAGINWRSPLMILKALNAAGSGDYQTVARAIRYAADNGARVINMSFGTDMDSSLLREAVDYALAKGVILLAAAGNGGGRVFYPAAYENVIGVGSIDRNDQKPGFANFGVGLDLVAPGVDILTADHRGVASYALSSGTSFSAAQVSGAASLLLALQNLTAAEILSLLKSTAENLGSNLLFGAGLLNSEQALSSLSLLPPLAAAATFSPSSAPADGVGQINVVVALQGGGNLFGRSLEIAMEGQNNLLNRRQLLSASPLGLGTSNSLGVINFSLASLEAGRKKVTLFSGGQKLTEFFVDFQPVTLSFQAEWVEQSAYPVLRPGEETTLSLRLRNIGRSTWLGQGASLSGQVRLGTDRPRDRRSLFQNPSWLLPNRPVLIKEAVVLPGETATFTFNLKAAQTGRFREYFRPVAEYLAWFNDMGIYWEIRVEETPLYDAKLIAQGSLASNDQIMLWTDFLNTGSGLWQEKGSNFSEVRLGTTDPQDHSSPWATAAWLSPNRAAALLNEVLPGSIGRFSLTVPASASLRQESFRLVAEFITWFGEKITFQL